MVNKLNTHFLCYQYRIVSIRKWIKNNTRCLDLLNVSLTCMFPFLEITLNPLKMVVVLSWVPLSSGIDLRTLLVIQSMVQVTQALKWLKQPNNDYLRYLFNDHKWRDNFSGLVLLIGLVNNTNKLLLSELKFVNLQIRLLSGARLTLVGRTQKREPLVWPLAGSEARATSSSGSKTPLAGPGVIISSLYQYNFNWRDGCVVELDLRFEPVVIDFFQVILLISYNVTHINQTNLYLFCQCLSLETTFCQITYTNIYLNIKFVFFLRKYNITTILTRSELL